MMKNMEVVKFKDEDIVASALLTLISKLSLTSPEESLQLLAMCAKDDLPKSNVLDYTLKIIEKNNYTNLM